MISTSKNKYTYEYKKKPLFVLVPLLSTTQIANQAFFAINQQEKKGNSYQVLVAIAASKMHKTQYFIKGLPFKYHWTRLSYYLLVNSKMKPPEKKPSWSLSSVSSHHQCYNLQIQFCVWLDDRDPVLFNEFFFFLTVLFWSYSN